MERDNFLTMRVNVSNAPSHLTASWAPAAVRFPLREQGAQPCRPALHTWREGGWMALWLSPPCSRLPCSFLLEIGRKCTCRLTCWLAVGEHARFYRIWYFFLITSIPSHLNTLMHLIPLDSSVLKICNFCSYKKHSMSSLLKFFS